MDYFIKIWNLDPYDNFQNEIDTWETNKADDTVLINVIMDD